MAFSFIDGNLIGVQVWQDAHTLATQSLHERIANHSLTSLELIIVWGAIGGALYAFARLAHSRSSASR